MRRHPRTKRLIKATLAAPPWVRRKDFYGMRERARALSAREGVPYVLDHIVPIDHPLVCGLTVPWNLRPVPARVNATRGNRWTPDQLEFALVSEPIQGAFRF